ncbi:MAG: hypothetical protein ACLQOZ_04060 [Acidimicrobiales bacterium]|jgi:hypothetical protein
MVDDAEPGQGLAGGGPSAGTGLAHRLSRVWESPRGRRTLVFSAGLVLAVVVLTVVVALFSSLAGESQSYRDGYSAGGSTYTTSGATRMGAEQACEQEETAGAGVGRPAHDSPAQWVQGCVAGFDAAESNN